MKIYRILVILHMIRLLPLFCATIPFDFIDNSLRTSLSLLLNSTDFEFQYSNIIH